MTIVFLCKLRFREHASIGGGGAGIGGGFMSIERLSDMLRHLGKDKDAVLAQKLADIYIDSTVASYTNMRAMAKIKAGQLPGPEMSIGKLSLTQNMFRVADFVSLALGPKLVADSGEWGTFAS